MARIRPRILMMMASAKNCSLNKPGLAPLVFPYADFPGTDGGAGSGQIHKVNAGHHQHQESHHGKDPDKGKVAIGLKLTIQIRSQVDHTDMPQLPFPVLPFIPMLTLAYLKQSVIP